MKRNLYKITISVLGTEAEYYVVASSYEAALSIYRKDVRIARIEMVTSEVLVEGDPR